MIYKNNKSQEYLVKSALRRLGFERVIRTENGELVALHFDKDGGRMANLNNMDLPSIKCGEELNLFQQGNFQMHEKQRIKYCEEQLEKITNVIRKAKNKENVDLLIAEYFMGKIWAIAICKYKNNDKHGRVEVFFLKQDTCSGCEEYKQIKNGNENTHLNIYSKQVLIIPISDIPDDENLFSIIKERINKFLPQLELEFIDEANEPIDS